MTLLRRAPREVYRVYSEEEFFAIADRDERFDSSGATGERRLHRVAGATVLLAVTGAVGGLIAIASLSAATGARRRVGASRLASTRPFISAPATRSRVLRESHGVGRARRPDPHRQRDARRAGPARAVPRSLAVATPVRSARPTASAAVATAARPLRMTASSAAAAPQASGQSEFGFER
jgi:hypothetical protein